MSYWIQMISVLTAVSMFLGRPLSAAPLNERVLWRNTLLDGRELVVTLDPAAPVTLIKELLPKRGLLASQLCSLNVEVRSATHAPLRLWSSLEFLLDVWERDEYAVLDANLATNGFIFVLARPKSTINVIEVPIGGASRTTLIPGSEWSLLGAAIPNAPGRLSAQLGYDDATKRISVRITDYLKDTKQHTVFEQKDNEWEFVCIKRSQEKVPATDASGK